MTALEKIYKEAAEKLDKMHGELQVQLVFVEKLAEILNDSDNNTLNSNGTPDSAPHKKRRKHEETNDCKAIKYAMQKHKPMKIAMVVEKVKENGIEIGIKTVSNYLDHKDCFIRTGWGIYRLRKNTKKIKRSEINIG